jgi:hypothetical protein
MGEGAVRASPAPSLTADVPDGELRRLCAQVRLRLYRRIAWAAQLRERDDLPWRDAWADRDGLVAWAADDERGRELTGALGAVASARHERLDRVCEIFHLDDAERDVLLFCLALAVDSSLAPILAEADGRGYPTEAAIAHAFDHGVTRPVSPESPLLRWELVEVRDAGPGEPVTLAIDPLIRDWICGRPRLDELMVGGARVVEARAALSGWPVADLAGTIAEVVRGGGRARARVIGPPGLGRRTFAAAVGEALGMAVLAIDADAVGDEQWPRLYRRAQRQAYLDGIAPAWHGETIFQRRWPEDVTPFPVQFLIAERGQAIAPSPTSVDLATRLPAPSIADRVELWRGAGGARWPVDAVDRLAGRLSAVPGEIVAAMARQPTTIEAAADAIREGARERLGDLATWLECPFRWDDLVVSDSVREALADFAFEARERARFWEASPARRLFPQGRGLFALLAGPPGTGKSMAAQVIAAELGLDLFRISLSAVVSKYVGETARNLQRILARAETMDAVLLFDEADALFSKRTEVKDAHDRYANSDTNHLLQAVESFGGIAILASNKKASIDPAFLRRLRYVVELPRPDVAHRRELWHRLLGEMAGVEIVAVLESVIDALAADLELTGAQIKNAILMAAFAARRDATPIAIRHLLRGIERELAKDGRSFNDRERARFLDVR